MGTDLITAVSRLRTQNLSDNQIIQSLQQEGHHPLEISRAIEAANRAQHYNQPQGGQFTMQQPQNQMNFQPQSVNNPGRFPPPQGPPQSNFPPPPQDDIGSDEVEQLIEAIIEEKWNEIRKNIDKILTWKEQTDNRLTQLTQQHKDLKEQFDKVHNAVLGKVGEYDKNIKEVGAQLQAMEKLFSDVLPKFTENVHALDRLTQRATQNKQL